MSDALPLNAEMAVTAILEMAQRRGLHAAHHEVERAWREVTVVREADRLAAVWAWVFPGHGAAFSPLSLMANSQLPAWVVRGDSIGMLTHIAADGAPAQVEWIGGSSPAQAAITSGERVLVPVPPMAAEAAEYLPQKQRGPATQAILVALKAHRPIFLQAGIASVFINLVAVITALFAMQVYDRVVPNFAEATLWYLASGVALALVLDLLFKLARMRLLETSERRLDEALSQHFFDSVLALKADRRPSHVGSLVAQIRDYEAVKGFFTASTLFTLSEIPFIAIFITLMALIGGVVALVPAVFVVACLLVGLAVYRPIARYQRLFNESSIRRQGLLYEAVSGAEMIKGQGGEARFGDIWQQVTRETTQRNEALRNTDSISQFITQMFQQLAYVGVLIVGVYVIAAGNMTMGGLIACSILGGRALGVITGIPRLLLRWHHASYALQTLNQLLSCASDDRPERQANTRSAALDLALTDINYGYGRSTKPQLTVANLRVAQGERIAVLGRNGSGKSTLLKLLAGVATPSGGQVTIAQLDFEHCRPSWLRETIGYLAQDVRLFSGTLLENLTLGLSMPAESEILAAMEQTGLATVLGQHADGLKLRINEGGTGLSGGQRQLVQLTRLVLQKPRIWLLDEPSASLDSEAEQRVMQLISKIPADCTVIFTTHRTTWLELAQRVIVVDGGRIRADEPREKIRAYTAEAAAKRTAAVATASH